MKWNRLMLGVWAVLLTGCAVGPDYKRPDVVVPAQWQDASQWKQASPQDLADRGRWWGIYHDPVLDGLEAQVAISNQNVKQAEAQYRAAAALLDAAMAAFLPTITGNVGTTTTQSATTMYAPKNANTLDNLSLSASWTADVWGKLRRAAEQQQGTVDSDQAAIQAALLSAQATLAESYLQLRALDGDVRMLQATIAADQHTLDVTNNLYQLGVDTRQDVEQATSQLWTVKAQLVDLGVQRRQFEDAIALLIGQPASGFHVAAVKTVPDVPDVPLTVPSSLLEHRPDIAVAERQVAAANAAIGVAQAAFFPSLTLSASNGYQGTSFPTLISVPDHYWSFGPKLAGTLFDGGVLLAQKHQAVALWEASVANYRQTVLTGFEQVENDLASLGVLQQEAEVQWRAVVSARRARDVAENQYEAGTVNYLVVLTADTAALAAEKSWNDIQGRRLVASASLVTDLGGGWQGLPVRPHSLFMPD